MNALALAESEDVRSSPSRPSSSKEVHRLIVENRQRRLIEPATRYCWEDLRLEYREEAGTKLYGSDFDPFVEIPHMISSERKIIEFLKGYQLNVVAASISIPAHFEASLPASTFTDSGSVVAVSELRFLKHLRQFVVDHGLIVAGVFFLSGIFALGLRYFGLVVPLLYTALAMLLVRSVLKRTTP